MTYESIYQFTATTNCSKSKIYRFYDRNKDLFKETKLKGKRMFPIKHARYFNSEIMFDENKILREQNNQLMNLITCLEDKDSLQTKLWYKNWTFFCTVSYKAERNKKSCFKQMHNLYNYLETKYFNTDLRLFFTTENFTDRKGYHNHFIMDVSDKDLQERVKTDIMNFFPYDRTDIMPYEKWKAGIFYVSKKGLNGEDWDILGNNLGGMKTNSNG